MITEQRVINQINPKECALDYAEACYQKWMGEVNFVADLADYLRHGVVISQPGLFGMAKIINLAGKNEPPELAWFVRMAVGNLRYLLAALPMYLPKICFCRRNDGRLRVYRLERLARRAVTMGVITTEKEE